jgi:hypothetical protein
MGDVHYYNYAADCTNVATFPKYSSTSFVSEGCPTELCILTLPLTHSHVCAPTVHQHSLRE